MRCSAIFLRSMRTSWGFSQQRTLNGGLLFLRIVNDGRKSRKGGQTTPTFALPNLCGTRSLPAAEALKKVILQSGVAQRSAVLAVLCGFSTLPQCFMFECYYDG